MKGPKRATRLGMLPVKEPDGMRPANIIAREGHEFFEADTAEKLYGEGEGVGSAILVKKEGVQGRWKWRLKGFESYTRDMGYYRLAWCKGSRVIQGPWCVLDELCCTHFVHVTLLHSPSPQTSSSAASLSFLSGI